MGRPAGWIQKLTGRAVMRSPGAPSLRREVERQFWKQIATGITSEKAAEAVGVREIARRIGRSSSTVSRELTRNAATRGGKLEYRASVAQWKSDLLARRPKPAKLVMNPRLRQYVHDRLEGKIHDAQGVRFPGHGKLRSSAATSLIVAIASG